VWLARAEGASDEQHATHLGRTVALLGLERLHRAQGALPARDRLATPLARRSSPPPR
jgi:hypothetical protein